MAVRYRVEIVHDADVGVGAFEGRRHVIDVAATRLVIDHRAGRQLVRDERNVECGVEVAAVRAMRGRAVARVEDGFNRVQLGLVGDVADNTSLGTRSKQSALRTFKHLDALDVRSVDVQVAAWQLCGLLVQIDGYVGKASGRAR